MAMLNAVLLKLRLFDAGAVALQVDGDGKGRDVRRERLDVHGKGGIRPSDRLRAQTQRVHLLQ
jgi:hypothetical protein